MTEDDYKKAAYLLAMFDDARALVIDTYLESDSKVKREVFSDHLQRRESQVPQSMRVLFLEVMGRMGGYYRDIVSRGHFVVDGTEEAIKAAVKEPEEKAKEKGEGKNGKRGEAKRRRARKPPAPPTEGSES